MSAPRGDDSAAAVAAGPVLAPLEVPGEWRSVGHRLGAVARALPDRIALESLSQRHTYAEVWDTATRWARALRRHTAAAPAGRPIALDVEADARCVVALVAIILSGRPAVPLDPMLPEARLERIVTASRATRIDAAGIAELAPGDDELPDADLDDAAVVFFTSGSTGAPKGVVHGHAAWLNQAYAARLSLDLRPEDRNALVLPLSFGAGLDVVFMSLLNGCDMYVHDPRVLGLAGLIDVLREPHLTTLHGTPSLLRSILDALTPGEVLPGLRAVTSCGEAIHSSLIERLRTHLEPHAHFVGWSGASEIGSLASFPIGPGDPVPPGILPVGRPVANKRVEIIGEDGRVLGPGETGEVSITSRYLSSGYFEDPAQTATRFRANPDGTTTYRGGDLGRWDDDGILRLLGRADVAVKVGGYLVEPLEVEGALLDLPVVREAVVTVQTTGEGDDRRARLVAHVVPVQAERATTPASLRRALRGQLPSWMVPADIVMLDALPRNERGKVAREALPPAPAPAGRTEPATTTERLLVGIWRSVLGVEEPSVDDDFWALGADSLSVEELRTDVAQATGVELSSGDLVRAPTIRELAALVDDHGRGTPDLPATAVRLRAGAADPAVFFFAGGGASALTLLPIAGALGADVAVHGFHASGFESRALPDWSLAAVVRRHLKVIRRLSPSGPYVLAGHSFGGLLALETAAELARRGERVPLVVLFDTVLPDRIVSGITPEAAAEGRRPGGVPPFRERMRMHGRLLRAGLVRFPPTVREAVFWEQSLRMINRHRLTEWPGRTVVFMAPDNPDDPSWWGRVLTGPHEVVPIDGGHSSILRPPFNRPIIDRLDAELASMHASHPDSETESS